MKSEHPSVRTVSMAARFLAAIAISTACGSALAQYVWTNEKGVRQYSDQPPPPSVPDSRIIRGKNMPTATGGASQAANSGAANPGAANPGAVNPGAARPDALGSGEAGARAKAPSIAERNAEFNKRRTQQAENEKKAAEEEKMAQQKKSNCERASNYKRTLESGARISRIGANGEQAVLNDEQRAQELREAQKALESCAG